MIRKNNTIFRCILHGSFNKHFKQIQQIHNIFTKAGIEVLAPALSEIQTTKNGFAFLDTDTSPDPKMIEIQYLHNLKKLGQEGFSYFVNPEGYIGKSASYELGIVQVTNTRCFFQHSLKDHPAYIHKNSIWKPEHLAEYIAVHNSLPPEMIRPNEKMIHKLWVDLMVPGSVVAVGGIIEHDSLKKEKEVLLVKTHKWGGRYSIVGGKVRRNELLDQAWLREIKEETGLRAKVGSHICTFDQIKSSGYYLKGVQHIFVDKVAKVQSKRVNLNDEAEDFLWVPPSVALRELDIEPNARLTLELYSKL